MSKHTDSQYIEISGPCGSREIEIAISYTFQRGYPASGPSYASGGEPGEPDGVEDVEFDLYEVDYSDSGKGRAPWKRGAKIEDVPAWLDAFIREAIDEAALIENACEYEGA